MIEFPVQIINRITALVVGPGLSRNPNMLAQVKDLLSRFPIIDIPIIFDGVLSHHFLKLTIFYRMEYFYSKIIMIYLGKVLKRSFSHQTIMNPNY